jgi:hypothetical protein
MTQFTSRKPGFINRISLLVVAAVLVPRIAQAKLVQISWKPVTHATRYEIQIRRGDEEVLNTQVEDTHWAGDLPFGAYTYQVRAWDVVDRPGQWSVPHSLVVIENIDRESTFTANSGFIALRLLYSGFNYKVRTPATGGADLSAPMISTSIGLSGERWFSSNWGAGMTFNYRSFMAVGESFTEPQVEVTATRRRLLESGERPFSLYLSVGAQMRKYTLILPTTDGSQLLRSEQIMTFGPTGSVDLRKQVSPKVSLGAKVSYYLPVSGGSSFNNWSLGLLSFYWWNASWAAGGGFFTEGRSLTRETSGGEETLNMNGSFLYGCLIWKFGQ